MPSKAKVELRQARVGEEGKQVHIVATAPQCLVVRKLIEHVIAV